MILDTFMFSGEADMLLFRLAHMRNRVTRHVIAEADVTHRGVPREPWLPRHLECCLASYRDRITYVPVTFPDQAMEPWDREHFQRDRIWDAVLTGELGEVKPEDVVIIADVDEIPSDAALITPLYRVAALRMRTFHSAVDWEYENPELAAVMVRAGCVSWPQGTLSKLRAARYGMPVIEDGGWHFSWVGTQEDRIRKLNERSCHNTDMGEFEATAIRTGATWRTGEHAGVRVRPVEADESFPEYIRDRLCPPYWFRPRLWNQL